MSNSDWHEPPILTQGRRIAVRLAGIMCFGIAFLGVSEKVFKPPALNFLFHAMPSISLVAALTAGAIVSAENLRHRIARRILEGSRVTAIPVLFEQDRISDEGIVTLWDGSIAFTGVSGEFRIGRSHVESVEKVRPSNLDREYRVTYRHGAEIRTLNLSDRTPISPFRAVPSVSLLGDALSAWLDKAPADATFEPPKAIVKSSSFFATSGGLLVWFGVYALAGYQMSRFPSGSDDMRSFAITLLLFVLSASLVTFIQWQALRLRILSEALPILLGRPVFSSQIIERPDSQSATEDEAPVRSVTW